MNLRLLDEAQLSKRSGFTQPVMTAPEPSYNSNQSVERRLSDLKREVDAIKRLLSQASLKRLNAEVERQAFDIDVVEEDLHRRI